MAQKRYKFSVSTSSFCFLCFDSMSVLTENSSSLQNIFNYLNISLEKIKTLSTKPVKLLNRTDVRVSLCSECEKTFQEILKLYKIIEVAQLKLDFNFEVVQKRLGSSKQSKIEEYQIQLDKHPENVSLRHSKLVAELRDEIHQKCEMKMPNYHPKVTLERVANSVITELTKRHTQGQNLGPPCEENLSVNSSINLNESQFLFEENPSVPILEVHSIKHDNEVDLGHADASDEPEINRNDDDWDEQALLRAEHCKDKSNRNHKINYKQTRNQVELKKQFAGPVPVEFRTCHVCKEVHLTREGLLDHLRMHSKETSSKYRSLYQRQLSTEKKWPCEVCKKSLSSKQRLKDHLNIHSNEKAFKCKFCPKRFINNDGLRRHLVCRHAESWEMVPVTMLKYQCNICHKICSTTQHLQRHARIHNKVFKCKSCGLAFPYKAHLKFHLKSHSNNV